MQTKVIECCETQAFVKVQSVFQALFVVFVVQRRPQELKTDELQDLFKLNKLYVWDRKEEVYSNMNAEVQAKSFSTSATQMNSPWINQISTNEELGCLVGSMEGLLMWTCDHASTTKQCCCEGLWQMRASNYLQVLPVQLFWKKHAAFPTQMLHVRIILTITFR